MGGHGEYRSENSVLDTLTFEEFHDLGSCHEKCQINEGYKIVYDNLLVTIVIISLFWDSPDLRNGRTEKKFRRLLRELKKLLLHNQ